MMRIALLLSLGLALGAPVHSQSIEDNFRKAVALSAQGRPSESAAAMRDAAADLWLQSPLSIATATFVNERASAFGVYDKKTDTVFETGESLRVYAEPIGYGWTADDNSFRNDIKVSARLLDAESQPIWQKDDFGFFSFTSGHRFMEFYLSLRLDTGGLPAGIYTLEYLVKDEVRDNVALISLPFTMR